MSSVLNSAPAVTPDLARKLHIRNILDKLRLHDRAHVVGDALRKKIVEE
ncbi:MAG: hypothetical protein ACXW3E_07075 [Thermoanaerobaculia bacterium]